MNLTENDLYLIECLIDERLELNRKIKNLTNKAIAEKFEVSAAEIAAIAKNGVPKRGLLNGRAGSDVRSHS
jgi:hypothetical protein